jgi:hypothetical protein
MHAILHRADQRRIAAERILRELALLERWQRFGRPVLVGAVAYDLVVSPDIDMEIYCPDLKIENGFEVLGACALHPRITGAKFVNALAQRDKALYWQLRYRDESDVAWKIDMWSAPRDYDLPRSESLVEPMRKVLTPDLRATILELKEARAVDETFECPSIDLYRAVLDDGVRTIDALKSWLGCHKTGELMDWMPLSGRST